MVKSMLLYLSDDVEDLIRSVHYISSHETLDNDCLKYIFRKRTD